MKAIASLTTCAAWLVAMLLCGSASAAITTSLEPRLVEEMDTIRLTLRVTGAANTEPLDLAPLQADFEVLGSNTQSQYRSVNGRVEAWVEYQVSLRPKRTGELVVPAITIGNDKSEAVTVMVRAMDPGVKQTIEQMVFFENELTANPVYVQAETVLQRRLYYANGVQIYSDLPGVPEIPNAVVIALGEAQSHSAIRGGQQYGVIEQQFAIFPEKSGTLIIPEISITSSVRLQSGGRVRRSGIRITSEEQRLEVLPVPAEYPRGQPWLPATDVRISETWSPKQASYKVGEPLHRAVGVTVVGNTGSAIPPFAIEYADEHFKWYPEAPALADENSGNQIVGTRIESYSLIPIKPGPAPLAEVAITWWDTEAQRVRVARSPRNALDITGTPATGQRAPDAAPDSADSAATGSPAAATETANGAPESRWLPWPPSRTLLTGLAIIAAMLVSVTLLARRRRQAAHYAPVPAASPSARSAWANLKRACRADDPHAMRTALVVFLEAHSGDATANAITQFVALDDNAAIWLRLNEAVYGQAGTATISGAQVLQAAARLRRRSPAPPADPLPALFS